jgi:gliding motility-associated-like protein
MAMKIAVFALFWKKAKNCFFCGLIVFFDITPDVSSIIRTQVVAKVMRICLTLLVTVVSVGMLYAQPGSISDPAVPAINPMNPDGNGFVTSTNTFFTGPLDETQFELPFLPLQQLEAEPGSDNQFKSGCEYYELVDDVSAGADAAYYYYRDPDGISDNGDELIVFRFRVAKYSPSSTAFSILIDTDYKFGFAGLEADPNAVVGNPGFEKEVSIYNSTGLAGGVRVFNVDGRTGDDVVDFYASMVSHYQVALALNRNPNLTCGTEYPAFVDMYVPFSSLGISASTQIRMAAATNEDIDNTLGGKAHDIGGVNGNAVPDDDAQFIALIKNYSPVHVVNPSHRSPLAADATVVLDEYAPNETVVHTVVATDANADVLTYAITAGNNLSAFFINSATGEITVANSAALDFESTPVIYLLVRVHDGNLYDNAIITIRLANINESPIATDALVSVAENSVYASSVHFVQVQDPDANTVLQFSITAGNSAGVFAVNASSGEIIVNDGTLLDYENPVTFTLHVQVTDGFLTDEAVIGISISDVNESPSLAGGAFSVDETAAVGIVVHVVEATDPDGGEVLHFAIIDGNTNNAFSIDNLSGEIKVNNSEGLDFETTPVFALNIRVSDENLFSDAVTSVTLADINEPPVLQSASVTLQLRLHNGDIIHTVSASDPDANDVVSYLIESGNDRALFALAGDTGEVSVQDAGTLNLRPETFELGILATDSKGLTGRATLQIAVARIPDRDDIHPQKGFSPNGDGNNDFWLIAGIEAFPGNFTRVFNRWGLVVFEAAGYDNNTIAWSGGAKATSNAESTYFYIIQAGDFEPITGYIIVKP